MLNKVTDGKANQTNYLYDASDRRTTTTDFGNGITSTAYDPAGNPIKITNPDGFAITFQYDEANRAIRAVDQEGNQVFTHRDVDGRPKCSKDPNGNSVFYTYWDNTRDSKLRRVTAPSANACPGLAPTTGVRAIEYDYDANGNVIQTTQIGSDGATRTSFTTYDSLNRSLQSIGPTYTDAAAAIIRPVTQTTYNLLGVLTQVQAGQCPSALTGCSAAATLATQMTYVFDDFGRKLGETDALAKATSFLYDINNNVTQVTDAKGQITSFTWNYGHLMATRTNLAAGNVNLTYNNLGQVSQALTNAAASTTTNLIQYDVSV